VAAKIIWRTIAIVIGGLFVYAGAVKIIDPAAFARDIDNYKVLPWQPSVWLAFYLPWLEILCGLALITRVLFRGAVFIVTGLMIVFVVASIVAKARGLETHVIGDAADVNSEDGGTILATIAQAYDLARSI